MSVENIIRRYKEAADPSTTELGILARMYNHNVQQFTLTTEHKNGVLLGGRDFRAALSLVQRGLLAPIGQPEQTKDTKKGWTRFFTTYTWELTPAGQDKITEVFGTKKLRTLGGK